MAVNDYREVVDDLSSAFGSRRALRGIAASPAVAERVLREFASAADHGDIGDVPLARFLLAPAMLRGPITAGLRPDAAQAALATYATAQQVGRSQTIRRGLESSDRVSKTLPASAFAASAGRTLHDVGLLNVDYFVSESTPSDAAPQVKSLQRFVTDAVARLEDQFACPERAKRLAAALDEDAFASEAERSAMGLHPLLLGNADPNDPDAWRAPQGAFSVAVPACEANHCTVRTDAEAAAWLASARGEQSPTAPLCTRAPPTRQQENPTPRAPARLLLRATRPRDDDDEDLPPPPQRAAVTLALPGRPSEPTLGVISRKGGGLQFNDAAEVSERRAAKVREKAERVAAADAKKAATAEQRATAAAKKAHRTERGRQTPGDVVEGSLSQRSTPLGDRASPTPSTHAANATPGSAAQPLSNRATPMPMLPPGTALSVEQALAVVPAAVREAALLVLENPCGSPPSTPA